VNDRQARLLYATGGLALVVVLSIATESQIKPSLSTSLWFEVLVWILLAAFLLEPFFAGPAIALTNAVAVIFICLAAGFEGPFEWWVFLATLASLAIVLLIVDFAARDPNASRTYRAQRIARFSRQIGVALGSWRFILVASLALTLATFNPPFQDGWIVSIITLLYVFALTRLDPRRMIAVLSGRDTSGGVSVAPERVSHLPKSSLLSPNRNHLPRAV
jgi:hypothetical protein